MTSLQKSYGIENFSGLTPSTYQKFEIAVKHAIKLGKRNFLVRNCSDCYQYQTSSFPQNVSENQGVFRSP